MEIAIFGREFETILAQFGTGGMDYRVVGAPEKVELELLDDATQRPIGDLSSMAAERTRSCTSGGQINSTSSYLSSRSKRAFDVTFALTFFLATIPVTAILCALICLTSEGSPIYVQERYGQGKKRIKVLKLRTMRKSATYEPFKQACPGDDRITWIGRILRSSSLDELPQFWCVLRGDMSIVGPRPHPIALDDEFEPKISGYERRFLAVPGITGLAQVNGARGATPTVESMQRRVEFDTEYIRTASLRTDLGIIVRTIFAVARGENAH